jgi:NAD(P)-dependent dehydrogenase (short-subunit alcohol dehydrogenase family)
MSGRRSAVHAHLESAFSLDGRVAVVTGAGKGIGRGTAIVLAEAGAHVVVADVDEPAAKETAAAVEELGGRATAVPTDVSQRAAVDALAQQALDAHGRLDVWVNVAGIIREGRVAEISEETFHGVVGVNLAGTYWAAPPRCAP